MRMLIPAVPADDPANRAYAEQLGQNWGPWPVAPAGSAPAQCENCHGAVLLDPDTCQLRQDLAGQGHAPLLYCLICVCRLLRIKHIAAPDPADDESFRRGLKRLREDPAYAHYIDQIAAGVESGPEKENRS